MTGAKSVRRATPVLLLALACLLAGCGGSGKPSIVLYNGQHPALTTALVKAFEKETGIEVRERTSDTIVLAAQILQEGHSPADVYLSENSPELETLEQRGVLAKLDPSVLRQVPAGYRSPAGKWVGVALRVSSLVYNPPIIRRSRLPASILELAQPQWKGKVALAPADSDFPPVVGAVLAEYGTKKATAWLAGIKRNAAIYQDEEAVVSAVNRGDVALGVINQYYWYRLQLEAGSKAMHSALYYFPGHDPGSIVNISGAAVLASSSHRQNAERFVRFLVSKTAQRILARSDDFEYPTRPGIAPNSALPKLETIPHTSLSVVSLGNDQQSSQLIRQAGLG
jgi:iron(III) transport system substrate-binding protein